MKKLLAIIFAVSLSIGSVAMTQTTISAGGPNQITQYKNPGKCC